MEIARQELIDQLAKAIIDAPVGKCITITLTRPANKVVYSAGDLGAENYMLKAEVADLIEAVTAALEMTDWFMKHSRQAAHAFEELKQPLHETVGWKALVDAGYDGLMASYTAQFSEALAKYKPKGAELKREIDWYPAATAPNDGLPFVIRASGWGIGIGVHDDEAGGFISLYGPTDWSKVTDWMRPE
jgi:hypothetical protein